MFKRVPWTISFTIMVLSVVIAGCSGGDAAGVADEPAPEVAEEQCPDPVTCPDPEIHVVDVVPYEEAWNESGHADADAEAFRHWDEDDPAEVPANCAKCHSTPGHLDFLGVDGSAFGSVEAAAPIGTTITCEACHNEVSETLSSVTLPSGAEITDLGASSRCMQCHQGRASKVTVDEAIAELGLTDSPDTPNEELGFINIHYYAAAASLFGSETHGGYEYDENAYQIRFAHVEGYTECTDCHNQHTLEIRIEECAACHEGVETVEDLYDQRMNGSLADYDGDGDREEGTYYEIVGLRDMLYQAMQAYSGEVLDSPIVYSEDAYPYFFIDTNGDGEVQEDEANRENAFASWTPRLLKAAYNYQVSLKDPGAFAHNAKYHVALLYDSIASLNEAISSPVDLSTAHRNDPGHFDGTGEPFRHWDEDGAVNAPCSRCHSAEGLPLWINEGAVIAQEPANGFACTTCHESLGGEWPRRVANDATFPSGATVTFGEAAEANLCIQCHQGRSSTNSVNAATAGIGDDAVSENLRFINIHYFAAGATLFGNDVQGAFQYAGKEYVGRNEHVNGFDECVECHNVHALEVRTEECAECHDVDDPHLIRVSETDFDGDGDLTEGLYGEFTTMHEALYVGIQDYAANRVGVPIEYNSGRYPYWFNADTGENFASWTPRLLRAAYNYQYGAKDPGAFAHNGLYVLQVMYDSLSDITGGAGTAGMTRP